MSITRKILILVTYISIFALSLLSAPNDRSILNTQVQCLNSSSQQKKCAYCWERPADLHPKDLLIVNFSLPNSHFITTKSCQNFTCQESLQFFTETNSLQNSKEARDFLTKSQSQILPEVPKVLTDPQEYHSWKILSIIPANSILPTHQSFWYTNASGLVFYKISQGLILAITFAILISTTLCHKSSFGENKINNYKVILLGAFSICTFYLAYNYVNAKSLEIAVSGIAKGLFFYYVINNSPALKDFASLSVVSLVLVSIISVYESFRIKTTLFSDFTLFIVFGILFVQSIGKKENWSLELLVVLVSLGVFVYSDYMLIERENSVWRVLRMISIGLGISFAHVSSLNLVEFEAVQGRPYWPGEERESEVIVEIEDSTII